MRSTKEAIYLVFIKVDENDHGNKMGTQFFHNFSEGFSGVLIPQAVVLIPQNKIFIKIHEQYSTKEAIYLVFTKCQKKKPIEIPDR